MWYSEKRDFFTFWNGKSSNNPKLLVKPNGAFLVMVCKNSKYALKCHVKNSLHVDLSAYDVQASLTCSNETASLEIKLKHVDRVLKMTAN